MALLVAGVPGTARAAFNDASLTTDVVLSVGGNSLNISAATAVVSSIAVGASSFSVTLDSGSSIDIVSSDALALVTSAQGQNIAADSCSSSQSRLKLTSSTDGVTVTVTPGSTCVGNFASTDPANYNSAAGSGGGGGGSGSPAYGGGGGGGGGVSTTPVTTPASTPTTMTAGERTALIASLQSQVAALVAQLRALTGGASPNANAYANANANASFERDLQLGSTGEDARALQVWLNAHGYAVALSGAGSSGNETAKFGGLTKAALAKFQASVGISPAAGYFGPKTRAYIAAHP